MRSFGRGRRPRIAGTHGFDVAIEARDATRAAEASVGVVARPEARGWRAEAEAEVGRSGMRWQLARGEGRAGGLGRLARLSDKR